MRRVRLEHKEKQRTTEEEEEEMEGRVDIIKYSTLSLMLLRGFNHDSRITSTVSPVSACVSPV